MQRRRRGTFAVLFAVGLVLTACADNGPEVQPTGESRATSSPDDETLSEGEAKWANDPNKLARYRTDFQVCSAFSPREIAAEYGIASEDAAEVALEFAQDRVRPDFVQPAFEGCLAGFEAAGY